MTLRALPLAAVLALLAFAGCTWEGRPDGASAVHTDSDGYFDDEYSDDAGLDGISGVDATIDVPVIDPTMGDDEAAVASSQQARDSPVPLDQPAPTTGSADNTTEVEEALTPGTEQ